MARQYTRVALKIAAIYALTGCLWIVFSDRAVGLFTSDPDMITSISIAKGWVYVLLTAMLLYWLIQRYIDEVRLSVEKLTASEEKFSVAFNHSPVLMTISAIDNGSYLEVNESFCQVSGFSRQEAIGKTPVTIGWLSAVDRERMMTVLRRDGRIHDMELTLTAKDGRKVSSLNSAELVILNGEQHLLTIALDITERKEAEKAIKESEERYRRFSSLTTDYVYSCRRSAAEPFRTQWMAGAIEEITGYTTEEIMAWGCWLPIVHPDDVKRISSGLLSLVPGSRTADEFRIVRKDGTTCWISEACSCEAGTSPGELVLYGTSRDITVSKEAEDAIIIMNDHLEQLVAERTAALQQSNEELASFCYAISHEIRAPITRLQGFSSILEEACTESGDISFMAARIANASRQLQSMVDSLLMLSRLSRVELSLQQVDLSEMVKQKAALLLAESPERCLELIVKPCVRAVADPALMEICLDNLLGNAFKYTGQTAAARIEFGVVNDSGQKVYFVRDNGAGFDMTYSEKLYAPFQRLHQHKEFPGDGIGLATVKRIIERHGGEIWADSGVGEGAAFYFTLGCTG